MKKRTPTTKQPDQLSPSAVKRLTQLHARELLLRCSEPNRRSNELVAAARHFRELVLLFLEDVPRDAAAAVLEQAGYDDPGDATRFGGELFNSFREKVTELDEALTDFLVIAGGDPIASPEAA